MKMEQTPKSPNFFKKVGILTGFLVGILTEIFSKMSDAELQHWSSKKTFLQTKVLEMFNQTDLYVDEREVWRKFYQKFFSLDLNVADVRIPDVPTEGEWRLIIVARGLTLNQVYDRMSKAFKCWKYANDLDASVTKNARDTKETYAIWVRVGVEPDEKYLGKSTNQADPDMKIGMTLLERMLLEIIYFDETGKHLDVVGWTLCTGSRDSGGGVPAVGGRSGGEEVRVYWGDPDGSAARNGLRSAVS